MKIDLAHLIPTIYITHIIQKWRLEQNGSQVTKCCPLLTCVSTESQKRTSVLLTKRAFLATRSMTCKNVGLVLSYAKLLLSSWKTYMCNLKAWFINRFGDSYGHKLFSTLFLFCYDRDFTSKREVPRGVRNSKVRRQDKFRRDWSRH